MRLRIVAKGTNAFLVGLTLAAASATAAPGFITQGMNLRAGPGIDYPLVAQLPRGTPTEIFGCLAGWSWCDVAAEGVRGWVAGAGLQVLDEDRPEPLDGYGVAAGLPFVGFDVDNYWGHHYRERPWFHDAARWRGEGPHGGPPGGLGGHDRVFDRGPERGFDRGPDGGPDHGPDHSPERGFDRGPESSPRAPFGAPFHGQPEVGHPVGPAGFQRHGPEPERGPAPFPDRTPGRAPDRAPEHGPGPEAPAMRPGPEPGRAPPPAPHPEPPPQAAPAGAHPNPGRPEGHGGRNEPPP